MENVTFQDIVQLDGSTVSYAIIDKGNGEFTSMLKADYDTLAANSAPTAQ
jgi:hypothetical protein